MLEVLRIFAILIPLTVTYTGSYKNYMDSCQ